MEIKVSIVIPNYNGRKLLEKNLPKVIAACQTRGQGWEIIVVDDASTDDSVKFLQNNYQQVKIVRHQKNRRFAAACNSGVKAAHGQIVIFLNSDVIPEKDFLPPLIAHFKETLVFAVGCREKDFRQGKLVYSGRAEARFERGLLVHWRAVNQDGNDTFWAAAGSMAVDREKYLKLGGMDTLYRPAYYEDIDLSYRARLAGWKILFEPKSVVLHHHETTNISVFGRNQMKKFAYKNQFLFIWKNAGFRLLSEHLFWLPYHLAKGAITDDWILWVGFFLALSQLPEAVQKR